MRTRSVPIAVVERETGINKDLLRKWEIRYAFPTPRRTSNGFREYTWDQVKVLQKIKRLIDSGVRAREAIQLCTRQEPGVPEEAAEQSRSHHPFEASCLAAIQAHDPKELHALLYRGLIALGLRDFVGLVAAPLTRTVGEKWRRGDLHIYEEHMFSATLTDLLSEVNRGLEIKKDAKPCVLLTTVPGEPHTLGLHMVRVLFAEAGYNCVFLGPQLPLAEIAAAADSYGADILVLSFSTAYPERLLAPTLQELKTLLPADMQIWIGGAGALASSRLPDGVRAFVTTDDAMAMLQQEFPAKPTP